MWDSLEALCALCRSTLFSRNVTTQLPLFSYLVMATSFFRVFYFGVPAQLFCGDSVWLFVPANYVPHSTLWWVNFLYFVMFSVPNVLVLAQFGIITRIWAAVCQDVSFGGKHRVLSVKRLFQVAVGLCTYRSLRRSLRSTARVVC